MKSLAELKRTIKPGMQLRAVEHWQPHMIGVVRTVTETQGNGYWYTLPAEVHESRHPAVLGKVPTNRYWSGYGKASEFSFPTDNSYRYQSGDKGWTLEFVTPASLAFAKEVANG